MVQLLSRNGKSLKGKSASVVSEVWSHLRATCSMHDARKWDIEGEYGVNTRYIFNLMLLLQQF